MGKRTEGERDPELLTTKQVANRLKRWEATLGSWRKKGKGPEFIREGSRIFYRPEDVEKWEKEWKVKENEKRKQDVECLSPAQLSGRIGMSLAILSNWRIKGLEPAFFRDGIRILYKLEDVEKWEKENPRDPNLLTPPQVAARLNCPTATLGYWREKEQKERGLGPPFFKNGLFKNGHRYLYRLEDVEKWEKERKVKVKVKEKRKQDVECLSPAQLSGRLGISLTILWKWRIKGLGPEFIRKGHRVLYKLEDVEKWEKERKK